LFSQPSAGARRAESADGEHAQHLAVPRHTQVHKPERVEPGPRGAAHAALSRPNTVRSHLKSIYRKPGVRSQAERFERLHGSEWRS